MMHLGDYCQAVIEGGRLTTQAQAVLWMLARFVNRDTATTWVSNQRLGQSVGMNVETVRTYVAELADAGAITREDRPGRSPITRFPCHPAFAAELSTPRGTSRDLPRGTSRGVPRGLPSVTPRITVGNPAEQSATYSYEPIEPARGEPVDNADDPTPGWFKDRLARQIEAETVDVIDPEPAPRKLEPPRMMWEVSM
jgi:Helix-turn-helix domain